MRKILLLFALAITTALQGQNLPACDSLVINCCAFDSLGPNTVTIHVTNYSSVLFDYPSFVLFDNSMDTIAKETVTYFGIGQGPQPHTMDIVAPLILPFTGKLNLYTLFNVSLACSFSFSIPDTASGIQSMENDKLLSVHPNPASDFVTLEMDGTVHGDLFMILIDVSGKEVRQAVFSSSEFRFSVNDLSSGVYQLRITGEDQNLIGSRLLLVQSE